MKCRRQSLLLLALLAALWLPAARVQAQAFGLGVVPSASSLLVSNSLTYTINVTNFIGDLIPTALVSNALPASVQLVSAGASQGSFTNYGSVVVFDLGPFGVAQIAQLTLNVLPTAAAAITNFVTVATTNFASNFSVGTNVVTLVTNTVTPAADLAVALSVAPSTVIVNDWTTFALSAFNPGSNAVAGIALTNTLPPGVLLRGVAPAGQSYSLVGSNLVFTLASLAAGSGTNLYITVQPVVTGVLPFTAAIGAAGVVDSNVTNNTAATNLSVINYLSNPLLVVTNSPQTNNPQNGLLEQSVLVSNNAGTNVPAVRVVVSNLSKQLFNAVGTNNGSPFVVLNAPLAAAKDAALLLQFSPRGAFAFSNAQLQAFAVPPVDLSPPPPAATSSLINVSRILRLGNGSVLLEFPAILGRTYSVVYSDNVAFSNAAVAPPGVVAPANRVQWIDYGPPTTTAPPSAAPARFYRVFLNP